MKYVILLLVLAILLVWFRKEGNEVKDDSNLMGFIINQSKGSGTTQRSYDTGDEYDPKKVNSDDGSSRGYVSNERR